MTTSDSESAFLLLHTLVRAAVAQLGWRRLHPIQVRTILAFFRSLSDLIVAAPTASGKTEAVFLPILSALVADLKPSVQVLVIIPLKSLINDQYERLTRLAQ